MDGTLQSNVSLTAQVSHQDPQAPLRSVEGNPVSGNRGGTREGKALPEVTQPVEGARTRAGGGGQVSRAHVHPELKLRLVGGLSGGLGKPCLDNGSLCQLCFKAERDPGREGPAGCWVSRPGLQF